LWPTFLQEEELPQKTQKTQKITSAKQEAIAATVDRN
jgi:hypothetical protein